MRIVDKLTDKRQKGYSLYTGKTLVFFGFGLMSNKLFCLVLLAFVVNITRGG
tara:strand:- start:1659 stop:1814 length:156 start_codon:yes stop_codon:yes gene_type:complete